MPRANSGIIINQFIRQKRQIHTHSFAVRLRAVSSVFETDPVVGQSGSDRVGFGLLHGVADKIAKCSQGG